MHYSHIYKVMAILSYPGLNFSQGQSEKECQSRQIASLHTAGTTLPGLFLTLIPCAVSSFHLRVTSHQSCPMMVNTRMSGLDFTIQTKCTLVYPYLASRGNLFWYCSSSCNGIRGNLVNTFKRALKFKSFWILETQYPIQL